MRFFVSNVFHRKSNNNQVSCQHENVFVLKWISLIAIEFIT